MVNNEVQSKILIDLEDNVIAITHVWLKQFLESDEDYILKYCTK